MSCRLFYEGEREDDFMLVINPDECIDCGVCVPDCPIGAIKPESPGLIEWVERAKDFIENKGWKILPKKNLLCLMPINLKMRKISLINT